MKKITQLLLFLLLSIPIQGTLLAQCGPGQNVIQDQTNANYTTPGTSEYAQDFIVNCDGAIEAVKIIFVGVVVPSSGTLKVYSDLAGTIVIASSATISLPVGNSTQIIPLTSPLPVTNGTPYLFAFLEDNTEQIGYRAYNSDVYPDGNLKVRSVGGTIWNETPYDLYFEVMYRDDVAPVAVCQNYTAQLDATGSITITGADVDGGSSDDSGSFTLSLDTDTFSCADKGANTVTLTITDGAGNTDTCTATVTVVDTIDPIISCPAPISVSNDLGTCGAVVTYSQPTASDNCSSGVLNILFVSDNGAATEIETALINEGHSVTAVYNDYSGGDNATLQGALASYDLIYWHASGSVGYGDTHNLATFTNLDSFVANGGNVFVTGYDVIANPTDSNMISFLGGTSTNDIAPSYGTLNGPNNLTTGFSDITGMTITAPNGDQDNLNGLAPSVITVLPGSATGGAEWAINDVPGGEIAWVSSGQSGTSTFSAWTTVGSGYHEALLNFAFNTSGVTPTQTAGLPSGATFPVGTTTNTFVVTDAAGNTATCSFDVTVEDNEAPMITCIADDTRDTDAGVCQYTVVGTEFDATFTDNCTSGSITNDFNGTATIAGEILPKGITTVLWTVNDGNGQSATCTTVITVEDNEAPMITCVADDTRDTDPGVCQYTVVGTEFDATFTDNCSDGSITNDLNGTATIAGEIFTPGITTVVWTVDDGNGQSATCTTVITVEDNEAPVMACPTDVVANTDLGICGAVVIFSDAIAFDNCGIASVIQTAGLSSGSLFPVGVSTIEYTATDINGNNTTCDFTITITDNEVPITVCQDITIQLDATGTASIIASDVDGGSTDNCGIASTTIDMDTFDCSNVGPNNVTLTVTDVNGNVSTCIAVVTVEDITAPVVVCQDITVQLDPTTGTVTILGADVDGGSTDVCGITSYDLDVDTFDCSNIGDNPVILTVTDSNGNTATCSAIVTVEDNTMPELVCMDFTIELDENGMATLTPDDVIATNTDACGIQTTAVDITEFSCSDIGTPVTVQIFSQDMNGNLATCNATVTVVDLLGPEVTCPADQTVDPGTGNLFYEVPDYFATGEATATDNCTDPVVITSQDPAAGTLLSDGVYTVTCTAEDAYGNVSNCTFQLTVDSVLGTNDATIDVSSIGLYPNPASDFVNINNPQLIHLKQLHVYDLMGRLVISESLEGVGASKAIDVSILQSATYMFIIQTENGQIRKQIIKD